MTAAQRRKMEADYEAAKDFIRSERIIMNGCMCQDCQRARTEQASLKAQAIVYPELPIVPQNIATTRPEQRLKHLYLLRQHNSDISARNKKLEKSLKQKNTLTYCRYCGQLTDDFKTRSGMPMCPDCYNKQVECADCGKWHDKYSSGTGVDDKGKKILLCQSCRNDSSRWKLCNVCHCWCKVGSLVSYLHSRREEGINYYQVCPKCDKGNNIKCPECNESTHKLIAQTINGTIMCPACAAEHQGMHDYYYKPLRLNWHRQEQEGRVSERAFHMGFEIEATQWDSSINRRTMPHMIADRYGIKRFYCVHDGTIERACGKAGCEFVSHPMTWYAYRRDAEVYDDMLLFLRNKGWKANKPGIGLHVHTTKAAWGTYQVYKLLDLIYNNLDFVSLIAQREPTNYCKVTSAEMKSKKQIAKLKRNRDPNHYSIINLNTSEGNASKTIEFRMFQGTLEPLYFHKSIEFVKACYDFTQESTKMTSANMIQFITAYRRKFRCLYEFINMKGIV